MKFAGAGREFARVNNVDSFWQDYQRRRWMRPNAHLYVRPDAALWQQPDRKLWQAPDLTERKYNPDQPRIPAGGPDGGQWTDGSSGLIHLAGDIPTGDSPEIPKEKPPTSQERTGLLKDVARRISEFGLTIEAFAKVNAWLRTRSAEIESYGDPPKSLEELQRDTSRSAPGYDIHHIVEQTQAEKDGFTRGVIDDPDNLVQIPRLKHQEINAWYQTKNPEFGSLSPREYLSGRSWEVRRAVGLDAMRIFGVLKP